VNKTVLVSKLLKLSINGEKCGVSFSRSFLDDFGSSFSGVKVSANGTPQGSILSPILFSIMISDISRHVFSPSALYADDLLFWETGGDIKLLEERCQESLSKVPTWCISGCRPVYQETQTIIGAVSTYQCSHTIKKGIQVFGSYFSK